LHSWSDVTRLTVRCDKDYAPAMSCPSSMLYATFKRHILACAIRLKKSASDFESGSLRENRMLLHASEHMT
jgi:hypothetical protein